MGGASQLTADADTDAELQGGPTVEVHVQTPEGGASPAPEDVSPSTPTNPVWRCFNLRALCMIQVLVLHQ